MPQAPRSPLSFALVIPALNEEEAIGSTLERALAARQEVMEKTLVKAMHVVFVNDGCTDGTQEIADRHPEVIKVRFEKNRGYGAAIKAGFQATDAEIVGFMDADGTCDPRFCAQLINNLLAENSDIAVGSRMNTESEMPFVRRFGNWVFAWLIGAVAGQKLTDSASGMRVLRRSSLPKMHPLPNGLHFTPAMTCLALLDSRLKITEVPMPYKERMGESKLRVVTDGFRFLLTILFSAALFNPIASLTILGCLFFLFGLALCRAAHFLGAEWPVLLAVVGGFGAVLLQATFVGFLCHQAMDELLGLLPRSNFVVSVLHHHFWTKQMVKAGGIILGFGLVFCVASLWLPPPWRTPLGFLGAFSILVAGWTALGGVVLRVVWAAKQRRIAELEDPYAVRKSGDRAHKL